jgi:hypothetical protein
VLAVRASPLLEVQNFNKNKMEFIKIPEKQLIKEPMTCSCRDRFSHPAFTRKIPKGITPSDYDKDEKLIEIEFTDGERRWVHIKEFFGKVIAEVKDILLLFPDGNTESLSIVSVDFVKVKRTLYWKLIFERDLPF